MSVAVYSSVQPMLAMLNEPDDEIKMFALEALDSKIDVFWSELSSSLNIIEDLAEKTSFPSRKLAAKVVAQVYFYLGALSDSLRFCLESDLFNENDGAKSFFRDSMLAYAIDSYITYRGTQFPQHLLPEEFKSSRPKLVLSELQRVASEVMGDADSSDLAEDPRVQQLVFKSIAEAVKFKDWHSALGLALETNHQDKIKEVLVSADCDAAPMLEYLLRFACSFISSRQYKEELLRLLIELYTLPTKQASSCPNVTSQGYIVRSSQLPMVSNVGALVECLFLLEEHQRVADILNKLSCGDADDKMLVIQIVLDLYESQNHSNLDNVLKEFIKVSGVVPYEEPAATGTAEGTANVTGEGANNTLKVFLPKTFEVGPGAVDMTSLRASAVDFEKKYTEAEEKRKTAAAKEGKKATDATAAAAAVSPTGEKSELPSFTFVNNTFSPAVPVTAIPQPVSEGLRNMSNAQVVCAVLSGSLPARTYLHFLYSKARVDNQWWDYLHNHLTAHNSTLQTALVTGAGIALSGTRRDEWIRSNWSWIDEGFSWAKFTSRSVLGMIYRGDEEHAVHSLTPFLPDSATAASSKPHVAGGSLFALGLASCGLNGEKHLPLISSSLTNANENVQHGACLGSGLAAMGTGNTDLIASYRDIIVGDSAVAGEAAGYALGCVTAGLLHDHPLLPEEVIAYMRGNDHEKTVRGCGVGLALTCIGARETASSIWNMMLAESNSSIRYGGVFALALAHVGTGNSTAISELLRIAVSDSSDDVRRAAVFGVTFVAINEPASIPALLSSLGESFNPYVRHATAIAVGMGTANLVDNDQGVAIQAKLLEDKSEVVRQGAFIGFSFLVMCRPHDASAFHRAMAANVKKEKKKTSEYRSPLKILRNAIRSQLARRGDTIAKVGALYAAGIAEAGGCNSTFSLVTQHNQPKLTAIVGAVLFLQFWFWQPIVPCISLALQPSAVIGMTASLKVPSSFQIAMAGNLQHIGYVDARDSKKTSHTKKKVVNALSQSGRVAGKKAAPAPVVQEVRTTPCAFSTILQAGMQQVDNAEEDSVVIANNPARVPRSQTRLVAIKDKYQPVKPITVGITVLRTLDKEEEWVDTAKKAEDDVVVVSQSDAEESPVRVEAVPAEEAENMTDK